MIINNNMVRIAAFPVFIENTAPFPSVAREFLTLTNANAIIQQATKELFSTYVTGVFPKATGGTVRACVPTTAGVYVPYLKKATFFDIDEETGYCISLKNGEILTSGANMQDIAIWGGLVSKFRAFFAQYPDLEKRQQEYEELTPATGASETTTTTRTRGENSTDTDEYNGQPATVTSYPTGKRSRTASANDSDTSTHTTNISAGELIDNTERMRDIKSPFAEFVRDLILTFVVFSSDVSEWTLPELKSGWELWGA